jgi:hypothetical protein
VSSRIKGSGAPLFIGLALLALAVSCVSETGSEAANSGEEVRIADNLALTPPVDGIQIQTAGALIDAGDDVEWCEVVQLPGSPQIIYEIDEIEAVITAYAHYVLVSAAVPGSETETNMETGTRVACQRAGEVYGNDLIDLFATRERREKTRYPQGVGALLQGGQKIVVDYQYFNTSKEPIPARVKINFHFAQKSSVTHQARLAMLDNLTIYTPPGGESSHLGECYFNQDVSISSMARHTHNSGTNFKVWLAQSKRAESLIWDSRSPKNSSDRLILASPIQLRAGEGLRFQCDYRNNTSEPLQFGAKVNDEVCQLEVTLWASSQGNELEEQSCLLFTVDEDGVSRN